MNKSKATEMNVLRSREMESYGDSDTDTNDPNLMNYAKKSRSHTNMLSARRRLSKMIASTKLVEGWKNAIRSGNSLSKREFKTIARFTGEDTALACVIRDAVSFDGAKSKNKFLGKVKHKGMDCSSIFEERITSVLDFEFDLNNESEYSLCFRLCEKGNYSEARRILSNVLSSYNDVTYVYKQDLITGEVSGLSMGKFKDYLSEMSSDDRSGIYGYIKWTIRCKGRLDLVVKESRRDITISKGDKISNYFNESLIMDTEWRRCIVVNSSKSNDDCFSKRYGEVSIERVSYLGNTYNMVMGIRAGLGTNLAGQLKYGDDGLDSVMTETYLMEVTKNALSLNKLLDYVIDSEILHRMTILSMLKVITYVLEETRGYEALEEVISGLDNSSETCLECVPPHCLAELNYESIAYDCDDHGDEKRVVSYEDKVRMKVVLDKIRSQIEPTQDLILKSLMTSVYSGKIECTLDTHSSIDRVWIDQMYGIDDNTRIVLDNKKTCIVDTYDNYYVSIPSSRTIYVYYKNSTADITDVSTDQQMFESKPSTAAMRTLVDLCCVFKPSENVQGSVALDLNRITRNRDLAEEGLIYMIGNRSGQIKEDYNRNRVAWSTRKVKISQIESLCIPDCLVDKQDRAWFVREIVSSYIKAGVWYSVDSEYKCYAEAIGGQISDSGGLEFDVPLSLEGVRSEEISDEITGKVFNRSGMVDLIESECTWIGSKVYNSRPVTGEEYYSEKKQGKKTMSGYVGGSDHEFNLAALFRAVDKMINKGSEDVDEVLEDGSIEQASVEHIREMYQTDSVKAIGVLSGLGHDKHKVIPGVLKEKQDNGIKRDSEQSKCMNRKLAVIANKTSEMIAESKGIPAPDIKDHQVLDFLDKNVENYGGYMRFMAGVLQLGGVGTVDSVVAAYRAEKSTRDTKRETGNTSDNMTERREDTTSLDSKVMVKQMTNDTKMTVIKVFMIEDVLTQNHEIPDCEDIPGKQNVKVDVASKKGVERAGLLSNSNVDKKAEVSHQPESEKEEIVILDPVEMTVDYSEEDDEDVIERIGVNRYDKTSNGEISRDETKNDRKRKSGNRRSKDRKVRQIMERGKNKQTKKKKDKRSTVKRGIINTNVTQEVARKVRKSERKEEKPMITSCIVKRTVDKSKISGSTTGRRKEVSVWHTRKRTPIMLDDEAIEIVRKILRSTHRRPGNSREIIVNNNNKYKNKNIPVKKERDRKKDVDAYGPVGYRDSEEDLGDWRVTQRSFIEEMKRARTTHFKTKR